jgi:predicted DNA-binding transcriptional regulator AlpA
LQLSWTLFYMTDDHLLEPSIVSERWKIPVKTLYHWHAMGVGPPVYKIGRHLRYREADIASWLPEHRSPVAAQTPVPAVQSTEHERRRRP